MICLIKDNAIVFGPAPWSSRAILEHLIIAGFDIMDGSLYGPDKAVLGAFPDTEPEAPLALSGFTILPAVEMDEPTPEAKMLAGREPVILADRVELRPVWVDIPLAPVIPPVPPTVSKLEFRMLLTQAERLTIEEIIDPGSTDERRFAVRDIEKSWQAADFIALARPRTIEAVNGLETLGVIAAGRAAEILEGA